MTPDQESCITCGDVAVTALVLEVRGNTATVAADGRREQVGIELVAPVRPGDTVLCHAGIAVSRIAEPA